MKYILNKLRSRSGASMILAMVFMLFCSFIGGTVLASATANAQRVAQMAEQQDFLLERSAALLVSDQLQLESGKYIRLNVVDAYQSRQEMVKGNGGVFDPSGTAPTVKRVVTFQVVTNTTPTKMHQLMLEATVWRFLLENEVKASDTVVLQNFPGSPSGVNKFLFKPMDVLPSEYSSADVFELEGTLNVTASNFAAASNGGQTVTIPSYVANFSCGRDANMYDFAVDFGENTQVKMSMNAYSGTGNPIEVTAPTVEDTTSSTGFIRVTTTSEQTTISWENPLIEKGGAAR